MLYLICTFLGVLFGVFSISIFASKKVTYLLQQNNRLLKENASLLGRLKASRISHKKLIKKWGERAG